MLGMSSYVETDLHVYPEGDDTGALAVVHSILWDTESDSTTLRVLNRPPAWCLHDDLQTSHPFASCTHILSSASFSCFFHIFLPPAAPPTTTVIGGQKEQGVMPSGPTHWSTAAVQS